MINSDVFMKGGCQGGVVGVVGNGQLFLGVGLGWLIGLTGLIGGGYPEVVGVALRQLGLE